MKKTVIHVITGLGDGGAEGVLTRLCLASDKVRHVVVSLTDEGKYGECLRSSGIEVICLGMRSNFPDPMKLVKLVRIIGRVKPYVVQTWMYHADFLGGVAARLAGYPVIWGIRHSTLEYGKSSTSTIWIAKACAWLSAWVPQKIICCADGAAQVHRELGYAPEKLMVIPNGYDLDRFMPSQQLRQTTRSELGVLPDEFLIGMVGRFNPQKDHGTLLRALEYVLHSGVSFRCVLIGTGMDLDNPALSRLIAETGMVGRVELLGRRDDIPAIMNALDLHVLSSSYGEAFPNVLAEAMACRTPCVATDVGDSASIVGDTGDICPPANPDHLFESIQAMIGEWKNEPTLWRSRCDQSADRVREMYSLSRMVAAFESAWLQL